jgi:hypothetical protein
MRRPVSIVAVAAFLAACSGPERADVPPPPPPGAIQLINASSYPIDEVYVTRSSSPTWGSNRTAGAIPTGFSLTVGGLTPGSWDAWAVSYGGEGAYFTFAWSLPVVSGETLDLSVGNSSYTGSLKVINGNANYALTELYVLPTVGDWSSNLLADGGPIDASTSGVLDGLTPDDYDYECVHSDGFSQTGAATIGSHALTSITCN